MSKASETTHTGKLSTTKSFVMVFSLLACICIGHAILKLPLQPMLMLAAIIAGILAFTSGYSWADLEEGICSRIKQTLPALLIMFTVGFLIASLIFSGSIPMLIYYGLRIIDPKYLVICSFIMCAILSTATGTSWGSAGTAGVALIGVATILDVPLAPVAGAIVAGATFGDKCSPLSDTTVLAALACGTGLYDHVRAMLWTTVPSAIIAGICYFIYGMNFDLDAQMPEHITLMLNTLDNMYNWSFLLLIPFILILWGAITKKPTLPVMLAACIVALLLGTFYQGFPFSAGLTAGATGFNLSLIGIEADSVPAEIVTLLQRGGLSSMSNIVLTILCAYCFVGIAMCSGALQTCVDFALQKVKTRGSTICIAVISTIILTIICTVSSLSSIIVGESFRKAYLQQRLDLSILSRTTEDGGTMISSIMPFTSSGLFYMGALGISPTVYWPWQLLAFLCPILAIIYGYTGFGLKYITQEEADKKMKEYGYITE